MASSIWGNPRQTRDIDMMVTLTTEQAAMIQAQLGHDFLMSVDEVRAALDDSSPWRSFQILHVGELFKFDVFLPLHDRYFSSLIERARVVSFNDVEMTVMAPEDILILKLRWYELGNRVSDRQWNDIVQVIEVQGSHLDREYVRQWACHFGLSELAEEAFSEALPP